MSARVDLKNLPLVAIPTAVPFAPQQQPSTQPTVNPFLPSGYERTTVKLADGTQIALPTLSNEEQQHVQSLFGGLSSEQLTTLDASSRQLARSIYQSLGNTPNVAAQDPSSTDDGDGDSDSTDDSSWSAPTAQVPQQQHLNTAVPSSVSAAFGTGIAATQSGLSAPGTSPSPSTSIVAPAVATSINQAAQTYQSVAGPQSYDNTVEAVSYMGMLGLQNQLFDFAKEVQGNVQSQNTVRVDLEDLSQVMQNWPAGAQTQNFSWTDFDKYGKPVQHNNVPLTQDQAKSLQDNLRSELTSMSDTNQTQQLQLQDMTQKYQEGINTISNLLKFEHDTVKSIINNIHT